MRRTRSWLATVSAGVLGASAAVIAVATPAAAVLSTGCTQTAGTGNVTCAFTTDGESPIIVPAGVTSVHVVAVGAQGGPGFGSGALGASVVADVPVTAGSTVYAEVNIGGGAGRSATIGFGGGASDLRTCSTGDVCGALGTVADPRLVVAGGGGGMGMAGGGGAPGAAGVGGSSSCNPGGNGGPGTAGFSGGGGGGGGCVAGGAGGLGASAPNGAAGTAGQGGAGQTAGQGGGGGGGGYFGGGGGGGDAIPGNSGGGGGGSSFAESTATNVVMSTATSGTASLTVTFVRPPDHLVLAPASATVTDGTSQAFTVAAVDSDGNTLGDLTSASTLTIAGGGTCTGAICTVSGIGAHTVTATDGAASATATLTATAAGRTRHRCR